MTVYAYGRVSTEEQEDGASLSQQLSKCIGLAAIADLEEPVSVRDVCSGSIPLAERPNGSTMLSGLQSGDAIICAKLDRMFRSASDALNRAEEFAARGIKLYLIDMGVESVTTNGASKFFFTLLAGMAEFERWRIKERTSDGRKGKLAKGGHIGGTAPFGFRVVGSGKLAGLEPVPEEQAAIVEMRALKAQGLALRTIAIRMNDRGIKISHQGVKRVLGRGSVEGS